MELSKTIPKAAPLPRPTGAGDCPSEFRMYLLGGDHWRVGKRVRGERARFSGFALHRSGGGDDGQTGMQQYDGEFLEFLEQALLEDKIDGALHAAAVRRHWIEGAMRIIERGSSDGKRDIEALRYFLPPMGRRNLSVIQMASAMDCSTTALRDAAYRGVRRVWDEIGGAW